MKARRFVAVVLAATLLLLSLGLGGWWWVWQRSPLGLQHQALVVPRTARFLPRQAPLSLVLLSDADKPVAYARAVAPPRQRRQAAEAIEALRAGAFAAAGLDYSTELASWLGPEIGLGLIGGDGERAPDGWLLALRSRNSDGARRFLQRFWQTRSLAGADLQISSYRGMGLISGRGALGGSDAVPLATALINDDLVLIASGRGVLEQALDVSQLDELNLAASPALQQALPRLGAGAALITARGPALHDWLGLPAESASALRTLVAAVRPDRASLELEGWLEPAADAEPWQARLDRLPVDGLLQALRGEAASLALLQQPAAWPAPLQPLLQRALAGASGPLPPLLLAADGGPLLWSQGGAGWLFGTGAAQPALDALEPELARQGLITAPLQLADQGEVRVWTSIAAEARTGRRDAPELAARLAGVRAERGGLAWWADTLASLQPLRGGQPPRQRLAQLDALALPTAPLQWVGGPATARSLLQSWRPWQLLAGLAARPFTPAVQGLGVALEPEGSSLHLRVRLDLG